VPDLLLGGTVSESKGRETAVPLISNILRRRFDEQASVIEARKKRLHDEVVSKEERDRMNREDKSPMSPLAWINNHYFSGSISDALWPKWRDVFVRAYEEQFHVIVFGGATRSGKSMTAHAIQGYSLYLTSMMGVPQKNFRIMEESPLLYLNMNTTDLKARSSYFKKFYSWVQATTYFNKDFSYRRNVSTQLQFPKHVVCRYSGATPGAAESEDLLFFVGDEVNLYEIVERSRRTQEGQRYDAAELVEAAVHRRMNGTFMRADGSFPDPCKVIWLCKETYPNSFIRRLIEKVRREGLQKKILVVESTEWGMKPDGAYEKKWFWVRTSSRMESSRILMVEEEAKREKAEARRRELDEHIKDDEKFKVIDVPLVHLASAQQNTEMFIRDMIGLPTEAISLYLKDRSIVEEAIRKPGKENPLGTCVHPFTREETSFDDGVVFTSCFCEQIELEKDVKTWRPAKNPNTARFCRIDAGLTNDRMGFAMGHQAGWKKVLRFDLQGTPVEEVAPIIWIDLMLRIKPTAKGEVEFGLARKLIHTLSKCGFLIQKVTMDQYQHVALDQPLRESGYETEVTSVDKKMDAYDCLKMELQERRFSFYEYSPFIEEITQLERIVSGGGRNGEPNIKIDHRPNGSKDVADAVAGVCWEIELAAKRDFTQPPVLMQREQPKIIIEVAKEAANFNDAFDRGDFEAMMNMRREW
jgi:hypothetical protein